MRSRQRIGLIISASSYETVLAHVRKREYRAVKIL